MARVAFCHGASSQFQDSGREHGQRVELASSAKFLEAAVDKNVTSRSLPDLDDCVLAHALHSHTRSTSAEFPNSCPIGRTRRIA